MTTSQVPRSAYETSVMPGSGLELGSARAGFSLVGEPTNGFDANLSTPAGLTLAWPSPSVLVTGDGARRWTPSLSVGDGFWGVDVLNLNHAWAVGVTGLYRTVDRGKRWQQAAEPGTPLVRVAFADPRRGFGLTLAGGLVTSDDSGRSWQESAWHRRADALCAPLPGVVMVADRTGGLWRSGNGGRSWRRVATGLAPVGQLSAWYSDLSCQGTNAVELAQAFCEAACGGQVDSRVRQTTDAGLEWRTILSQRAGAGGLHVDPGSGPRIPIVRVAAVGSQGVCLVGSTYGGPAEVVTSCTTHAGEAYRTAPVPRPSLPFGSHVSIAVQGLEFLNATTGWLLFDEYTSAATPASSRARTEVSTTHTGGRMWRATYASPTYHGRWCSEQHTSTCWR